MARHAAAARVQVASFMRAVLRTVAQCHSKNILHRDIKPGEGQPLCMPGCKWLSYVSLRCKPLAARDYRQCGGVWTLPGALRGITESAHYLSFQVLGMPAQSPGPCYTVPVLYRPPLTHAILCLYCIVRPWPMRYCACTASSAPGPCDTVPVLYRPPLAHAILCLQHSETTCCVRGAEPNPMRATVCIHP
jgi:hypothetical protein